MIVTIIVCLAFLGLAAINAVFSQPANDYVFNHDDEFLPPVLKSEGVYRSFAINVCFLGIATVIGGFQFGSSTHFTISGLALLSVVSSLACGFLAAICLKSSSTDKVNTRRVPWVALFVALSLVIFGVSVAAVYKTPNKNDATLSSNQEQPLNENRDGQKESQDG